MNESPFMVLLYVGVAAYVGYMYWGDYQSNQASEQPDPRGMPGATSASWGLYGIGVIGALLILAAETGGEIALGIASEQSEMVWYFVFAILGAGIVEEIIFRGYLVVDNKGRAALIGSCVGFSLIFAIIHVYLVFYHDYIVRNGTTSSMIGGWKFQEEGKEEPDIYIYIYCVQMFRPNK